MSQWLHIGKTEESFYDCVLANEKGAREELLSEWLCLGGRYFLGPWKIRIGDIGLFTKLEPIISEALEYIGKQYPDDVWVFYLNDREIEHPTREELIEWLELPNKTNSADANSRTAD